MASRNERVQIPGMSAEVKIGKAAGVLLMVAGVYFLLFSANDNMPDGPDDDDDLWEHFRKLWDPPFNPG